MTLRTQGWIEMSPALPFRNVCCDQDGLLRHIGSGQLQVCQVKGQGKARSGQGIISLEIRNRPAAEPVTEIQVIENYESQSLNTSQCLNQKSTGHVTGTNTK